MDEDAVNFNSSAKKDDGSCSFKPLITIVGSNPASVSVGVVYTDAGATAFVKNEGSVDVTSDLTQVNTSTVGSFVVTYSASNTHGTTTATRLVNVVLGQSSYIGNFDASNECNALQFPHINEPQIQAGANANQVLINNAFTAIGGTIVMNINGANVTVPPTTIPIVALGVEIGNLNFSGTGTMNSTGNQMVVSYDYDGTAGQGICIVTYVK